MIVRRMLGTRQASYSLIIYIHSVVQESPRALYLEGLKFLLMVSCHDLTLTPGQKDGNDQNLKEL